MVQTMNVMEAYHQESDTAKCMEVIVTRILRRGDGKSDKDPIRIVTEVFTKDGVKIAEYDPINANNIQNVAEPIRNGW